MPTGERTRGIVLWKDVVPLYRNNNCSRIEISLRPQASLLFIVAEVMEHLLQQDGYIQPRPRADGLSRNGLGYGKAYALT